MALIVPNQSLLPLQSRVFQSDWEILGLGVGGANGVVSGCAVTEAATPNMTVVVASGSVVSDFTLVAITGGTVALDASDPTDPRFDLIVANDDGTVGVVTGTADPAPISPGPGTGQVALKQILIPAGDVAVTNNQMVSKFVKVPIPSGVATNWTKVSADTDVARQSNALVADDDLHFLAAASTKYAIRMRVFLSALTASKAKFGWLGPTAPTLIRVTGYAQNQLNATPTVVTTRSAYESTGITLGTNAICEWEIYLDCILHNGANATPNFSFAWGQLTTIAEDTIRRAGSYLEYAVA